MKKLTLCASLLSLPFLAGCTIGDKAMGMNIIYAVTTVFSLLLLIGYCSLMKKREPWFIVLFSSVLIVNAGYLWLSVSKTVEEALWANRVSYLGSVFLPLSMLMIILEVSRLKYTKRVLILLIPISIFVFLIAASPGYLDIYYKSASLENINGVSVLVKDYGPWHPLYLFYLISYFAVMLAIIIHGRTKKTIESTSHEVILLIAVFVNICVWLLEQLVKIEFEFLSISYIITELFLLGLYLVIQDNARLLEEQKKAVTPREAPDISLDLESSAEFDAKCRYLFNNLHTLTHTERLIFDLYLEEKSTKEVLKEMNITENTLKYHNKNIYSKLGVSSRKQLIRYACVKQDVE